MTKEPLIDFDATDNEFDVEQRYRFWESTRPWLRNRGYELFEPLSKDDPCPVSFRPSCDTQPTGEHPYAPYCGGNADALEGYPDLGAVSFGRVVFAQDAEGRHVAIKIVKHTTEEYRILRFLSSCPQVLNSDMNEFPCVLPVLDFLQCGDCSFVIMPRWGESVFNPGLETVRDALQFMKCTLKGLVFLHKHRIVHGVYLYYLSLSWLLIPTQDIRPTNMLLNHFAMPYSIRSNRFRRKLRQNGQVVYALFDFDNSHMSPPARLSWTYSWLGNFYSPFDTLQGEYEYDPFAFDVGCLGTVFRHQFMGLPPKVPLLAPLFDKMVTWRIHERFTASEALDFLESIVQGLSPRVLYERTPGFRPGDDVWAGLPPDFTDQWSAYRQPKLPLMLKCLRWICQYKYCHMAVVFIRRQLQI